MDENTVEQLIILEVKNRLRQVKLKLGQVTLNLSIIQEAFQKIRADCRRQDKQNGLFRLTVLFCRYMYTLQVKFDFRLILI